MQKYLKFILVFVALSIIPLFFIGSSHVIINSINKKARKVVKQRVEQHLVKKLQQLVEQGFEPQQIEQQLVEQGFELQQIEQYFKQQHIELTKEQLDAKLEACYAWAREAAKEKANKKLLWVHRVERIRNLNQYSFYTKLLILSTLFSALLVCLLSFVSRINRLLLLISFKIGLFAIIAISSILILSQSILLAGAVYYLTSHFNNSIHPQLLFIIVIPGILVSLFLIASIFIKINKDHFAVGYSIQKNEQQELWEFVKEITSSIKTEIPDNIVLGLGSNYYVTQSDTSCLSGKLKGKTLFISLSCLYRFNQEEFGAIIAHELSHFKGKDTFYSLHFYPTWRKIADITSELDGAALGWGNIAKNTRDTYEGTISVAITAAIKPVRFLLVNFMEIFLLSEAKFRKDRERMADLNAGKLISNKDMANALVKLSFFSGFWNAVEHESANAVSNNQYIANKNVLFNDIINNSNVNMEDIKKTLETNTVSSHPMDSHPSLLERLRYLGVDLDDALKELYLSSKDKNAAFLIRNIYTIEEGISVAEQQIYANNNKTK